jgi:hypothetical protein
MIIPSKFEGYGEGGRLTSTRRVYDSGGGGSGTQTTVTDLPEWAKPYAQKSLAKTEALTTDKPYQSYANWASGRGIDPSQVAGFSGLQQQAFQGAGQLQPSAALETGMGLAGTAASRALGTQFNPYQTGQFGLQAGEYMSPFIQQALAPQMREAVRSSEMQRNMDQARAVGQGAFGGSRQAIVEAERQRNLGTQLGDIQAKGLQSAYDQARQQFTTEQQLREQSRQYGAGLGLQGLQTALQGAGQLGTLGTQQFGQEKDTIALQSQLGGQQQQLEQAKINQQIQEYQAQQKYPYQQLEFMSNILRGTPMGTVQSLYGAQPSPLSQLAGAGTALYGASKMMAEGGLASAYAEGGSVTDDRNVESILSKLSDAQLQQARQMAVARKDAMQVQMIDRELAERSAVRSAPQAGIDTLPTQDMDFADGGIVAFADGGAAYETQADRYYRESREQAERERAERLAAIEAAGGSTSSYGEQMGGLGRFIDQYVPDPRNIFKTLVSAPGYGLNKDAARAAEVAAPVSRPTEQMTAQQMESRVAARPAAPAPRANAGLGATLEAAAARRPAGPGIGAPSVQGAKELAGQFLDSKAVRDATDKFEAGERAAIDAARARREEGKPQGKAYSKYEEMLQAEEAGAGKEREDAKAAAIFKAGLAMMAGASPNALANIGKGAEAGLSEYTNAIKDMRKAAKERQKAFADIEQARRAEELGDYKAKNEFEDKADARLSKARELGVRGIMDVTGKSADIAAGIYKTQVTEAGQTQRASIMADARTGGGGEKQTLNELKALQSSLQNQLKTEFNKDQRMAINAQLSRVNAAIAEMAGLSTIGGAPGAPSPGGTMSGWGKASVVNP